MSLIVSLQSLLLACFNTACYIVASMTDICKSLSQDVLFLVLSELHPMYRKMNGGQLDEDLPQAQIQVISQTNQIFAAHFECELVRHGHPSRPVVFNKSVGSPGRRRAERECMTSKLFKAC